MSLLSAETKTAIHFSIGLKQLSNAHVRLQRYSVIGCSPDNKNDNKNQGVAGINSTGHKVDRFNKSNLQIQQRGRLVIVSDQGDVPMIPQNLCRTLLEKCGVSNYVRTYAGAPLRCQEKCHPLDTNSLVAFHHHPFGMFSAILLLDGIISSSMASMSSSSFKIAHVTTGGMESVMYVSYFLIAEKSRRK